MRGKDVDMLRGGFDRADRDDRRGENDIDAVFLRGFVGSDGKVDNVLPVEVGFRPDLKKRRADGMLVHTVTSFPQIAQL